MSLNDLYALSAIEHLWDRLEDEDVASPAWHKDVLEERKRRYENGELKLISLEELKQMR
jgi:hypothetical protein